MQNRQAGSLSYANLRSFCDRGAEHRELISHRRDRQIVETLILGDFGYLSLQADVAAIVKYDRFH